MWAFFAMGCRFLFQKPVEIKAVGHSPSHKEFVFTSSTSMQQI